MIAPPRRIPLAKGKFQQGIRAPAGHASSADRGILADSANCKSSLISPKSFCSCANLVLKRRRPTRVSHERIMIMKYFMLLFVYSKTGRTLSLTHTHATDTEIIVINRETFLDDPLRIVYSLLISLSSFSSKKYSLDTFRFTESKPVSGNKYNTL